MGKGSKWRKTDYQKFFDNFDNIKFSKKRKDESQKTVKVKKNKTTIKY